MSELVDYRLFIHAVTQDEKYLVAKIKQSKIEHRQINLSSATRVMSEIGMGKYLSVGYAKRVDNSCFTLQTIKSKQEFNNDGMHIFIFKDYMDIIHEPRIIRLLKDILEAQIYHTFIFVSDGRKKLPVELSRCIHTVDVPYADDEFIEYYIGKKRFRSEMIDMFKGLTLDEIDFLLSVGYDDEEKRLLLLMRDKYFEGSDVETLAEGMIRRKKISREIVKDAFRSTMKQKPKRNEAPTGI